MKLCRSGVSSSVSNFPRKFDACNLTPVTVVSRRGTCKDWRPAPLSLAAVDQDGDVLDILVQKHCDKRAAKRFFRKLLKGLCYAPRRIVTDKLRSYGAARKEVLPDVIHDNDKWQNNRAEVSHQPTRQRERQMRRFKLLFDSSNKINNLLRQAKSGEGGRHVDG